jgi:hypothetical protein
VFPVTIRSLNDRASRLGSYGTVFEIANRQLHGRAMSRDPHHALVTGGLDVRRLRLQDRIDIIADQLIPIARAIGAARPVRHRAGWRARYVSTWNPPEHVERER